MLGKTMTMAVMEMSNPPATGMGDDDDDVDDDVDVADDDEDDDGGDDGD